MAEIKSQGSRFLAAAFPRLLTSSGADIIITQSAPLFHFNSVGIPDISSITFTAQLLALEGTVQWSCDAGTLTNVNGNSVTLTASNMTANVATITATLVYRGVSFSRSTKISKIYDGNSSAGLSNAIIYAYKRSATAPTDNPGTVSYSFVSASITTPTLDNGWSKTIPAGSDTLYVVAASASNSTETDTIAASEWSGAVALATNGQNGTIGADGLSAATIFIYQRTSTLSSPAVPSTNVNYTFATGVLTGLNNGWSSFVPNGIGGFLWVSTATAANNTSSDVIAPTEWAQPSVMAQDGSAGIKNAVVYAFQRKATAPTVSPGDIVYDFAAAAISFPTTLMGGWLKAIPGGSDPLYVTTSSASSSAATDNISSGEWSTPVVLAQNGTQGLSVATVYIYQRTTTNVTPSLPGQSATFTFQPPSITGLTNGWTSTVPAASAGGYLWVSTATASNTTATDTILSSEWATAQLLSQDGTGVGTPGQNGNSTGTVTLYRWSTVVPANPAGTATFTWNMAATTAYSGSDGWFITAPGNPGGPGVKLFLAQVPVTAPYGTASTTVTFGNAQIIALSENGAAGTQGVPGLKTANVSAYQWALSAPTVTGTATYTWLSGTYNTPPSTGWTQVKGNAPGTGYTLYEATVRLTEATGAATSTIDWTLSSIAGIAYQGASGGAGSQGASARRAYVLVDGSTLAGTPTTLTMPGQALPTTGTWGETRAWQSTVPVYAAGQSVFQADGVYDPVPNQTVWNAPYLSALKVGSLSAISANLGAVTAGSIDLGTGALSWHVDSSGNQWAGAATYAAAPFKVSNTGNAVLSSFLLRNPANGETILSAGGLASGYEAPNTKNSELIPSINASSGINLVPRVGVTVVGSTITKTSAGGGWNSDAFSAEGYVGGAVAQATVASVGAMMFGLSTDPTSSVSFDNINYAWYVRDDGQLNIYESGVDRGNISSYIVGNVLTVTYDGSNVYYSKDGTILRTVAATLGQVPIYFDSSFYSLNASLRTVKLIPQSSNAAGNTANNALPGLNSSIADKLSKSANSTLAGTIALATQYAIQVGNANDGLFMGSTGLYGRKGGVTTFAVQNDGTAIFNGQLAAGSVTASMITTGSPDSLVPDIKFKDLFWWGRVGSLVGQWADAGNTTSGWIGGASLFLTQASGESASYSKPFQLTPGATYLLQCQVGLSNDFNGRFSAYMTVTGAADYNFVPSALSSWTDGLPVQLNNSSAKGTQTYTTTVTVPLSGTLSRGVIQLRNSHTAGTVEVGSISVTRVSDSVLIKNGAITADKINVNQLSAVSSELGTVNVSTAGYMRSGQPAWNVGTGWWWGMVNGVPKFSVGQAGGNSLYWDGVDLYLKIAPSAVGYVTPSYQVYTYPNNIQQTNTFIGTYSAGMRNPDGSEATNLSYQWSITSSNGQVSVIIDGNPNAKTVSARATFKVTDTSTDVYLNCNITNLDNNAVVKLGQALIVLQVGNS